MQWGEGYYNTGYTPFYLKARRYFDGITGRFLSRDPIDYGGGINQYAYCGNDPVNDADPSGFQKVIPRELYPDGGEPDFNFAPPPADNPDLPVDPDPSSAPADSGCPTAAGEDESGGDPESDINGNDFGSGGGVSEPWAGRDIPHGYDCGEIAEGYQNANGGQGSMLHFGPYPVKMYSDPTVITPEANGTEPYVYHQVWTFNGNVYDPRLQPGPIPEDDYLTVMGGWNQGITITRFWGTTDGN